MAAAAAVRLEVGEAEADEDEDELEQLLLEERSLKKLEASPRQIGQVRFVWREGNLEQ